MLPTFDQLLAIMFGMAGFWFFGLVIVALFKLGQSLWLLFKSGRIPYQMILERMAKPISCKWD